MSTPFELFQAGRLNDAVAAAIEGVKNKPGDVTARWNLCTLFCFTGDLDRVDKHLDLIGQQDVKNAAGVALFRQLVRAEAARRQFFAEGRVPEVIGKPNEEFQLRLAASIRVREGAMAEAAGLLAQAEQLRKPVAGTHEDHPFNDIRDLDDVTSSIFEVLTSTGKYYWIPIESVRVLEFRPPDGPRDLLWRRARMAVNDGPDGEVFLPALYPNSHAHADDRIRLGRLTDWIEGDNQPVRGVGHRMFLVGEDALGIGELKTLEFSAESSSDVKQ